MAEQLPAPPSTLPPAPRWPVTQRPFIAYSAAIALTLAALGIRLALDPAMGNAGRLAFFMFAATLSAFLFGQGPGIASTLLGTVLGVYYFIQPRHSFQIENMQLGFGVAASTAQGLIVCFCAGFLHRALQLRAKAQEETHILYESELRAHQATAEMNQTKDYFLAVLGHELRGPLSAIQYCTECRLTDPEVTGELREDFSIIDRSVKMQSRLITDLLDLTRLTRGKMELERHPLDLHALLDEAVRTSSTPGQTERAPIPTLHLKATHTHIEGDHDRLLQVFWNILRNAAKFTNRNGKIDVETFEPSAGRIAVRIRDTGIGLSEEALQRIFQPFEQAAQNSGAGKQGGLGLGLAIARGIVELHGGALTGHSDGPGQGTSFIVELPVIATPSPSPVPIPAGNVVTPLVPPEVIQSSASVA